MKYKIQEYLLIERDWSDIGELFYIDNSDELVMETKIRDITQSVNVKMNDKYNSIDVIDEVFMGEKQMYSKSISRATKRKFEIVEQGKKSKFTLIYENAYYSKIFPLILYKLEKKEKYNAFSNFVNSYYQISIKYYGKSEQEFDNKTYFCDHYYCLSLDNKNDKGSYIYFDKDGMIAMVNNTMRIIRV